jgi:hypothetical protein
VSLREHVGTSAKCILLGRQHRLRVVCSGRGRRRARRIRPRRYGVGARRLDSTLLPPRGSLRSRDLGRPRGGRARERPTQTSTTTSTVSLPASLRAARRGHLLEVREASFLKPDSSPRAAATSTPGRQIGIGRWRKRLSVGPIDVLAAGLCVVLGTRPPPADHLVRDRV